MLDGAMGAEMVGDITDIGEIGALALLILLIVLPISCFLLFVHFVESQSPGIKENLLDEARRDHCLDLVVKVVPESEQGIVYMFRFLSLVFFFMGLMLMSKAEIVIGMFIALFGSVIFYLVSPFGRNGRIIISPKLVISPNWMYRPMGLGTDIFRMENVEKVVVKRKSSKRRAIVGIVFQGKVRGSFRLSKKDSGKYDDILNYLRQMGVAVVDGD